MANFALASQLRDAAWLALPAMLHMKLRGIGLFERAPGEYGLRVLLPRRPSGTLPRTFTSQTLGEVELEYAVVAEEPLAMAGTAAGWRAL